MWWRKNNNSSSNNPILLTTATILVISAALILLFDVATSIFNRTTVEINTAIASINRPTPQNNDDISSISRRLTMINTPFSSSTNSHPVRLFQGVTSSDKHDVDIEINRMRATVSNAATEHLILNPEEQRSFLEKHGFNCFSSSKNDAALSEKYDELKKGGLPQIAHELWKYCALSLSTSSAISTDGSSAVDETSSLAYLDSESPLVSTFGDAFLQQQGIPPKRRNYAVLGSSKYFPKTMHGSFLFLSPFNAKVVAREMVKVIMESEVSSLTSNALLIPSKLYSLVESELTGIEEEEDGLKPGVYEGKNGEEWVLLDQRCHSDPFSSSSFSADDEFITEGNYRLAHHCPSHVGHCCDVIDPTLSSVVFLTQHPLLPYQLLPPPSSLPRPYAIDKKLVGDSALYQKEVFDEDNLPFISTIREEVFPRPEGHIATPNLYDKFLESNCLPPIPACTECLRKKTGATCNTCKKACGCYCQNLCKTKVEQKHVSKNVYVTPPVYSRDSSRLVPRIVHQTWFEAVDREKYPNMSRLIESWRQSGWEYRFYDDDAASTFISTHFPHEVLEAYNAIKPGAFKADLFRYCTLLINGGVYADMDILLEANLDAAVSGDVGFMSPVDEPGMVANRRHCLWNGMMAVAPGHPFVAKTIEVVVNSIRNRFTSVDYDGLLCPDPELSVSHKFDTLFSTGPCILGYTVNKVLGNHPQQQFDAGDVEQDNDQLGIPGRTIILKQNKIDMGAHRFTWVEKNLVVAATDLPDYDDRKTVEEPEGEEKREHYSKVHATTEIYGLHHLYTNHQKADENIQIIVK